MLTVERETERTKCDTEGCREAAKATLVRAKAETLTRLCLAHLRTYRDFYPDGDYVEIVPGVLRKAA